MSSHVTKKLTQNDWTILQRNELNLRGVTPYNGVYGEAPPERGTFLRLQVYKRVGISQVGVYKRVGKSVV